VSTPFAELLNFCSLQALFWCRRFRRSPSMCVKVVHCFDANINALSSDKRLGVPPFVHKHSDNTVTRGKIAPVSVARRQC